MLPHNKYHVILDPLLHFQEYFEKVHKLSFQEPKVKKRVLRSKDQEKQETLDGGFTNCAFIMICTLIFTKYYLNKEIGRSDIIGFIIVLLAYFTNILHLISKYVYKTDVPIENTVSTGNTGPIEHIEKK